MCLIASSFNNTFNIKAGYVPGETISFYVKIDNKSSREINLLSVTLMEKTIFYSTRKARTKLRKVIEEIYTKKIKENSIEMWSQRITIPTIISSSNSLCKIIEINYLLILRFNTSGVTTSKEISIPITIGTIPLYDENENLDQSVYTSQPQRQQPKFQQSIFQINNSNNSNTIFFSLININNLLFFLFLDEFKPYYAFYDNI